MKQFFSIIFLFFAVFSVFNFLNTKQQNYSFAKASAPKLAIVIDDFGSFDESGIDTILKSTVPLTCAVLPHTDNTQKHLELLKNTHHEIILHMPMQSHVSLPEGWYGPVYIKNTDTPETAINKIQSALSTFPEIKGFNIHIGSGVSQNKTLMTAIYNFAKLHNLYFLDSRTIETKTTADASKDTNSIYLGRDVFLEADKNRSYAGVIFRLQQSIESAKEKGYAIAIGHVGAEGGENTAKAILDMIPKIKNQGVEVVPLSQIYEELKTRTA